MRFTVPALLLFTFCHPGSGADDPTSDEKKTIEAVGKLGGKAEIDPKLPAAARVVATFEKAADATLFGLKKLPHVGAVEVIDATACTAAGLAGLKSLPNLRRFALNRATLAPAAVAAIGECKELRHLVLIASGLTDNELTGLKKLALLEHLALSENPGITDRGMATVKGFDRLQKLYLSQTGITDRGLAELKPLDGLRTLSVKGTKVTLGAAEKFPDGMPNLRKVTW